MRMSEATDGRKNYSLSLQPKKTFYGRSPVIYSSFKDNFSSLSIYLIVINLFL